MLILDVKTCWSSTLARPSRRAREIKSYAQGTLPRQLRASREREPHRRPRRHWSAVAVERIFSGGRDTIGLRRASLKPETARILMCGGAVPSMATSLLDGRMQYGAGDGAKHDGEGHASTVFGCFFTPAAAARVTARVDESWARARGVGGAWVEVEEKTGLRMRQEREQDDSERRMG
ncbi:hypothetical protein DFH08DRAFT_814766 [Mycena albidolilacea]|uniref:Uncharacterized protein n=1 Tax=Mycena albidolilacea TaxID=1033008 RepID=A0AAD6ZP53_9AGAR|nr:hypothetical protein DFH08DRAFT_814766 [Mycena albidolilacea]